MHVVSTCLGTVLAVPANIFPSSLVFLNVIVGDASILTMQFCNDVFNVLKYFVSFINKDAFWGNYLNCFHRWVGTGQFFTEHVGFSPSSYKRIQKSTEVYLLLYGWVFWVGVASSPENTPKTVLNWRHGAMSTM